MKSTLEFGKIWFNYYSQFMLPLLWNTIITWLLLSHLVCWNESPNYAAFFCYASWKIMASVALKHSALITWLCSHIFYTGRCPKLHEYMLENYLDHQVFSSNHILVSGTTSSNFWILLWDVCVRIMYVICLFFNQISNNEYLIEVKACKFVGIFRNHKKEKKSFLFMLD